MDLNRWLKENTFHHSQYSDLKRLVKLKEDRGLTVSVALPTLNEEKTIAKEVVIIKTELMDRYPLVDELAIIDSGSTDKTREIAATYGADVYLASEYLPEEGVYYGKGENLWKSLYILKGDIIVWIDADIKNIHPKFIYGLLGPLLEFPRLGYVKGFYERPIDLGKGLKPSGGGRVTQLLVRPLFCHFFPELAGMIQPLSGEYAGRREILEQMPFFIGYGVETGLLIDISNRFGIECIAQVDMDKRVHRNQVLEKLSEMSFQILQTFFHRAKDLGRVMLNTELQTEMAILKMTANQHILINKEIKEIERPPMITVKAYQELHKK
jgi:glucosyl-3-phosphoglycerate synthase